MGVFKSWLMENEEHPFVNWYKQYKDAAALERNLRTRADQHYWATRRAKFNKLPAPAALDPMAPPKVSSMQLLDSQKGYPVTQILHIMGRTDGTRGYGDEGDTPAGDPFADADWEVLIGSTEEIKLRGKPTLVVDKSWGSYHEAHGEMSVYVIDEVNGGQYLSKKEYMGIVKIFRFESLEKTFNELQSIQPNISYPGQEGESSEQYWKRIMATMDNRKNPHLNPSDNYDDDDNYYKRS